MKKLSAICMIFGFALFAGGCSTSDLSDHAASLKTSIAQAGADLKQPDSETDQADPASSDSTYEKVHIDELTGTLTDFDGTNITINHSGQSYVFDVSQAALECKYGVVLSDSVSVIYEGELTGTDTSAVRSLKVVDEYQKEHPLENRTLTGKVKHMTVNTLTIVTKKGNTVLIPTTGVEQYYKKGIKPGRWVYIHFRGKFTPHSQTGSKSYNGSLLKIISISDTEPLKVPAATPTPAPSTEKKKIKKEQRLRAKVLNVNATTIALQPQNSDVRLQIPITAVPVYFKGGFAPGSYANIIYTGKFNGSSLKGMHIKAVTGEYPEKITESHITSTVTGTILGTTANTVTIQTYDGAKIICNRENVPDTSTCGLTAGSDITVTINPAKSRTSNIYTCLKIEDA